MYHKFWPPHLNSFLCISFIAWLFKTKNDLWLHNALAQPGPTTHWHPNLTEQCNQTFPTFHYHNSGTFFSCISRWLICWNRFRSFAIVKHLTKSLLYLNSEWSLFDIMIQILAIHSVQVEASPKTEAVWFYFGDHSRFVSTDMDLSQSGAVVFDKTFVGRAFDICDTDMK